MICTFKFYEKKLSESIWKLIKKNISLQPLKQKSKRSKKVFDIFF